MDLRRERERERERERKRDILVKEHISVREHTLVMTCMNCVTFAREHILVAREHILVAVNSNASN